jgi:hypothetical protein
MYRQATYVTLFADGSRIRRDCQIGFWQDIPRVRNISTLNKRVLLNVIEEHVEFDEFKIRMFANEDEKRLIHREPAIVLTP